MILLNIQLIRFFKIPFNFKENMETTSPSVHDNIRTEALSNKTLQGALQVVREFLEYWNPAIFTVVSQSIIITPSVTHVTHMCMITAKDGLSVVAIDTTNNKVVGVAFNKIRVS